MENKDWERAKGLFVELLELPENEREAFIANNVGDNETVKSMLDMLMEGQDLSQKDNAVSRVVGSEAKAILKEQYQSQSGESIADYQIENVIGEGGMGTVYKAKRKDAQFEQTVAVKIIQVNAFEQKSIERFRQERQILASLQHPNIAQLIDGGETDAGLPYIVMEYIDGVDIVSFCKQHKLSIEARLDLFKQVMSAVDYAHQNLVIHRDIKPSNVLVDKNGVVKLLDFGIAKLIEDKALPEDKNLTAFEVKLLTPANASPEQVKHEKVTTRTDVYGLSTLLYQLLTEQALFDTSSATSHEVESWIVNRAPSKPSESVSSEHSTRELNIKSTLSGDLDTIILKGLQKEPDRRYSSVEQLSLDIQRYLSNYPIHAKPDSTFYKIGKFYQRNRAFSIVSLLFIVSLLSFAGAIVYQAVEIEKARVAAVREANNARQVSEFLSDTFEAANPYYSGDKQITPLDLVDNARSKIETIDTDDLLKLKLMLTIAEVYKSIGSFDNALELLVKADELSQGIGEAPEMEQLQIDVLNASIAVETQGAEKALQLNTAVLNKLEIKHSAETEIDSKLGKEHEVIELLLSALLTQGSIADRLSDYEAALKHSERALEIASYNEVDSSKWLSAIYGVLGHSHRRLLNYDESATWLAKSLDYSKAQYGEFNLETAYAYNQLASTYNYLERWEEAIDMANKSLEIRMALFPNGNAEIAASLGNLSNIYSAKGDSATAIEYRKQSVTEIERALGDEHVYVGASLMSLASLLIDDAKYSEAKQYVLEALPIMQSNLTNDSVDLARPYRLLGRIDYYQGAYQSGLAYLNQALDISEHAAPDGHWISAEAHAYLALTKFALGDKVTAAKHKDFALSLYTDIFGENSQRHNSMKETLADVEI